MSEIESNIICNNDASICGGGIYCMGGIAEIKNNLIANNSLHGMRNESCWFKLRNNSIVNNEGFAIYFVTDIFVESINDIIWGSLLGSFNTCSWTTLYQVQNSIIQDSVGTYPEFVLPTLGAGSGFDGLSADWSLLDISSAINAGNPDTSGLNLPAYDLNGFNRIIGDTIDIGAYEYDLDISIPEYNNHSNILFYPNPTTGKVWISTELFSFIELIDLNGEILIRSNENNLDLSNLSKGIYTIRIYTEKGVMIDKVILQ